MKRVAQSCWAIGMGTVDRILRNLRFDLSQRKVLLVFDEVQYLSIECLETLREPVKRIDAMMSGPECQYKSRL